MPRKTGCKVTNSQTIQPNFSSNLFCFFSPHSSTFASFLFSYCLLIIPLSTKAAAKIWQHFIPPIPPVKKNLRILFCQGPEQVFRCTNLLIYKALEHTPVFLSAAFFFAECSWQPERVAQKQFEQSKSSFSTTSQIRVFYFGKCPTTLSFAIHSLK